jgi:mono/diheme cytochrome c family protein
VRQADTVGDLRIVLTITPAQPGENTVEVAVTRNGAPAVGAIGATVRFAFQDEDLGENEVVLAPVGDARYVRRGPWLSVNGEWQANVIVKRIPGQEEVRTAFRFAIPTTTPIAPDLTPAVFALPSLTTSGTVALAMLALAGALIVVAVRMRRSGTLSGALFGAGAGALALAVYLLATGGLAAAPDPLTGQAAGPRNPIPATAQSLAQGRTLYTANCQSCHGVGGKGDGPQAASLNPPPLDLTQHVGFHSDAELNRFISQGVRGTAMPPFAGRLSQEEIWHLVNYIKTFDAYKGSG